MAVEKLIMEVEGTGNTDEDGIQYHGETSCGKGI